MLVSALYYSWMCVVHVCAHGCDIEHVGRRTSALRCSNSLDLLSLSHLSLQLVPSKRTKSNACHSMRFHIITAFQWNCLKLLFLFLPLLIQATILRLRGYCSGCILLTVPHLTLGFAAESAQCDFWSRFLPHSRGVQLHSSTTLHSIYRPEAPPTSTATAVLLYQNPFSQFASHSLV